MTTIRPTQEEVNTVVEEFLHKTPASISTLIKELCSGPNEMQVRRAAWALLYDSTKTELDQDLKIVFIDGDK